MKKQLFIELHEEPLIFLLMLPLNPAQRPPLKANKLPPVKIYFHGSSS